MLIDLSRVRVSGPLSAFATGFADHMTRQGYSQQQARIQLLLLNRLPEVIEATCWIPRGRGERGTSPNGIALSEQQIGAEPNEPAGATTWRP
jgi:hypothetical protein